MKSLREFILEWDLVNARRLKGRPWPWSADPVLQKYRFGNFRRELDRLNRVLITAFEGRGDDPYFVTDLVVNRMISQLDFTTSVLAEGWPGGSVGSFDDFMTIYNQRKREGLPLRPASFMSCRSEAAFLLAIQRSYENAWDFHGQIMEGPRLKTPYELFAPIIGKFTAWQLALDFLMVGYVHNPDQFVHVGPGAAVALQNLGMPPRVEPVRNSFLKILKLINENKNQMPLAIEELEGALCEYSKYVKLNNWAFPGKFRHYVPKLESLIEVATDSKLLQFYGDKI